MDTVRTPHPIEVESYRILRAACDTHGLPPRSRDVVERMVHTSADESWCADLILDEQALAAGAAALDGGAPLVVDAQTVCAGIAAYPSLCLMDSEAAYDISVRTGITLPAAGFQLAASRVADGAVWVAGSSPTALWELLRLAEGGVLRPALVIGLSVGYVGAAEAKAALRRSGLPAMSNVSAKGGAVVAAAAVNALLYGDIY